MNAEFEDRLRTLYGSERRLISKSLKQSRSLDNAGTTTLRFYDRLAQRFDDDCRVHKIPIACKEGCSYCCYLRVEAFAHEVFHIARHIRATFPQAALEQLMETLKERSARAQGLSAEEYHRRLIPCSLLEEDRCSVYAVRPVMCRRYHSMDLAYCRFAHDHPEITDAPSGVKRQSSLARDPVEATPFRFAGGVRKVLTPDLGTGSIVRGMGSAALTIGRLAREAGAHVETIRYYERRRLIARPPKPLYGFRYYPIETIARVNFINRAQRLGFTLREIADLLALGDGHCENVLELADHKRMRIEGQIADLTAMKKVLDELIHHCQTHSSSYSCPIVQSLSERAQGTGNVKKANVQDVVGHSPTRQHRFADLPKQH